MPVRENPLWRIRVLFTGWELRKGVLRRTPSLVQWEKDGEIRGKGWTLWAQGDGEYYEARDLFHHLGFRDTPGPFEMIFWAKGEAEALPLPVNPRELGRASRPVEEKQGGNSLQRDEEVSEEKKLKRVRIGPENSSPNPPAPSQRPEGKKGQGAPRSLQELYERLLSLLGEEEFSPLGVNPLLEFWGYSPEGVWEVLEKRGLLRRQGGFYLLQRVRKGVLSASAHGYKNV